MGDIKLSISIKEENNILFKRCVRKLLDSTFIVGDKDEKLYSFISRESNRQDISDYLRMIGFDVLVDTNVKIAMLGFMKEQNLQMIFCAPDKTELIGNECEVVLPVLRTQPDLMEIGIIEMHKGV